ncbi:MAG: sugar ABC transporter ATP-binding protein [Pleomorphochaeta sp.]
MTEEFIRLEKIKKYFTGVKALKGVDLTINTGEIHCLAGENGCGKSTLIKVISGAHEPTSGNIYINGEEVTHLNPIASIQHGIQVIYQDFAVFPNLSVAENIAMNNNLLNAKKRMNWKEARKLAEKAMSLVGADIDPDILVERLSISNKQMVAISRAIINDAKLLILDEPTTALTAREVELLNKTLINLKNKGMAIVIVNHKIDEIFDIADRLTILRNGENVATGLIEDFNRKTFIHHMTGRDIIDNIYTPNSNTKEVCKVSNLSLDGYFEDVSFSLTQGDVLGITGLLGSGRSEIGDTLFGITPATSGDIFINDEKVIIKSIFDAVNKGIGYVPEDRLTQGLFLSRSISDNTVAASLKTYMKKGRLDLQEIEEITNFWIEKIGCVASSPKAPIRTLSGGNAQKMVIAKWLNTHPNLLILNGPTVGVDIGSKSDIHKILHNLANEGMGIIIISDDLNELYFNCNKLIIMSNGISSGVLTTADYSEDEISKKIKEATAEENNE